MRPAVGEQRGHDCCSHHSDVDSKWCGMIVTVVWITEIVSTVETRSPGQKDSTPDAGVVGN